MSRDRSKQRRRQDARKRVERRQRLAQERLAETFLDAKPEAPNGSGMSTSAGLGPGCNVALFAVGLALALVVWQPYRWVSIVILVAMVLYGIGLRSGRS